MDRRQPVGSRLWHWKTEGLWRPKGEPGPAWGGDTWEEGRVQHLLGCTLCRQRAERGAVYEDTYPNESSEANLPGAEQPLRAARFLLQLFQEVFEVVGARPQLFLLPQEKRAESENFKLGNARMGRSPGGSMG